jgi:hypothetical protein
MMWSAVQGMKLKPYCCAACGSSPMEGTENEGEGPKQAYFAEGVDINWGDSLYLCDTCVRILGELRGMIDVDKAKKYAKQLDSLRVQYDGLQEEHAALEKRVERMLDGARAKKEVQTSRSTKKAA